MKFAIIFLCLPVFALNTPKEGEAEASPETKPLQRQPAFRGIPLQQVQTNKMPHSLSSTVTSGDATPLACESSYLSPRREFVETQRLSILDALKGLYAAQDSGERETLVARIANTNDVRIVVTENNGLGSVQTADIRPEQQIVFMVYIEDGALARIEFYDLRVSK